MKQHFLLLFCFFSLWISSVAHEGDSFAKSHQYIFTENKGQWDAKVNYKAEIDGAEIYFQSNAFHYQFIYRPNYHANVPSEDDTLVKGHVFEAQFIGANENPTFEVHEKSPFYYNYFLGNDKSKWQSMVRSYEKIEYKGLYQGIDLEVYAYQNSLKYDYRIAIGADPSQIKVKYAGADDVTISEEQLEVTHSLGKLLEQKPYAYQVIDGKEVEVRCVYEMNEKGEIGFTFPNSYRKDLELIIDPIIFSTYSGSRSGNFGATATYDTLGFGYMGGTVLTTGYNITLGAFQSSYQGGNVDMAISKFSPDGSQLIYATYLGGNRSDIISSMVVDHNLNLVVLGSSSSRDYPTSVNAYDNSKDISNQQLAFSGYGWTIAGGSDLVITKLNAQGSNIIGSTFFGGNSVDGINYSPSTSSNLTYNDELVYNYGDHIRGEVIVDQNNEIYIGSCTRSTIINGMLNQNQGGLEGIVAKFSSDLSSLNWARYHGGSGSDAVFSLKLLNGNKVLIGGGTNSTSNFPVRVPAYQTLRQGGRSDGFLATISSDGSTVEQATYVGTRNFDQIYFVETDRFGGIYALGVTNANLVGGAGSFPTLNSQISDNSGQFIVKLDSNLDNLQFSHTFGDTQGNGEINISPTAFLVDRCLNLYVSGWGGSLQGNAEGPKVLPTSMRIANNSGNQTTTGDGDAFYIYAVNRDLDSVLFASFFGDPNADDHVDGGTSRFDKEGVIYQSACASCLTGDTASGWPTTPNSFAPKKLITSGTNTCNNALLKYDLNILPKSNFSVNRTSGCEPYLATITDSSERASQVIYELFGQRFTFDEDTTILFNTPGTYIVKQFARDTICDAVDSSELIITVFPNPISLLPIPDTITCTQDSIDLTAVTNGTGTEFYWSTNPLFSDTLNQLGDSSIKIEPQIGGITYYLQVTDSAQNDCIRFDTVNVSYSPIDVNLTLSEDTICEQSNVRLNANLQNINSFIWNLGDGRTNSTDQILNTIYNTPGDYQIKLKGTNTQCQLSDSAIINLNVQANQLQISSLTDSIYCGLDTVDLIGNTFGTADEFIWSSNKLYSDTLNASTNDSIVSISNNVSDTFYLKVTDQFCELEEQVFQEYNQFEIDLSLSSDSGCAPFNTQIPTTLLGTTNFEINFGNGSSTTSNPNPSTTYTNPGIYQIRLIGENSRCNRSDTIVDSLVVLPEVTLQNITDTIICLGESINLIANSNGSANRFTWSTTPNFSIPLNAPQDSNLNISPTSSTNYFVLAEKQICSDQTDVLVRVEDLEVDLTDLESICRGDTLNLQALAVSFINPVSFDWEPADSILSGQNTSMVQVAPRNDLDFILTSNSSIGCEDIDTATVEVQQPAFEDALISATNDSIFKGELIQLSTNRNGSNLIYQWSPAELLDNPNSPTPNTNPNQTTVYQVTITDLNTGCEVVAFKRVKVFEINCAEPDIFIPSAFTPNGDGNNDLFRVRGNNLAEIELEVYNRWGQMVFKTNEINQGWDGTFQGKKADPGVFVYHLTVICLDRQEFYTQGNVTLIR